MWYYFQIDMVDIKTAFERLYGKSLKSWIKVGIYLCIWYILLILSVLQGDTSGHYKHALYALVGEQRS